MRTTRQMSVTLPLEMADLVRRKVEQGGYASESEVIREGLRALQSRDAAADEWLRREVGPIFDAHLADPATAVPLEHAFGGLEARRRARQAAAK